MREYHRALLRELDRYGLAARVSTTSGNHVRVEWDVEGKTYHIVTSNTPSDHRGLLNGRAQIRRQLRQIGYQPPTNGHRPRQPPRAREAEADDLRGRVEQLELDVVTLMEIIEGTPEPTPNKTEKKPARHMASLLLQMPIGEWLSLKQIVARTGRSNNAVAVALSNLKQKQLVEHDKVNHRWRKKIEAVL